MTTRYGKAVELHVDWENEDFRLYLRPGFTSQDVKAVLRSVSEMGLEPLDADEDDGAILEDGSVMVWLAETVPR